MIDDEFLHKRTHDSHILMTRDYHDAEPQKLDQLFRSGKRFRNEVEIGMVERRKVVMAAWAM